MKILITGVAGFVGFHVALNLINDGYEVIGVDNINNYYDQKLKKARLKILQNKKFIFYKINIINQYKMNELFLARKPNYVLHFAAQAGVRYSLLNPQAYLRSNLVGFLNVLECCRNHNVKHLIYASSSSVYGNSDKYPFDENQKVDKPVSFYAATKKSNEVMAYSYSHLYFLPTTGLRFFTVYGPWGRPDMAYFIFVKKILRGETINIFGKKDVQRDFTYIDDVVGSIKKLIFDGVTSDNLKTNIPYEIYNIGNSNPIKLSYLIKVIENILGKKANILKLKKQAGDVNYTSANTKKLKFKTSFSPSTKIEDGMKSFVDWYKSFYKY